MKKVLNNKEAKEAAEYIELRYGRTLGKKDKLEKDDNILLINSEAMFFYHDESVVPTLKNLLKDNFLKKITVDMGAVRFVAGGADIMRPGITAVDEGIGAGQYVAVVDQSHQRPLAVGITLFSGEEINAMATGKAVKNLHYVGDKIWGYS